MRTTEAWFAEYDSEGVAVEYVVWEGDFFQPLALAASYCAS